MKAAGLCRQRGRQRQGQQLQGCWQSTGSISQHVGAAANTAGCRTTPAFGTLTAALPPCLQLQLSSMPRVKLRLLHKTTHRLHTVRHKGIRRGRTGPAA